MTAAQATVLENSAANCKYHGTLGFAGDVRQTQIRPPSQRKNPISNGEVTDRVI
jgi:hypothetical protein